MRYPLILSSMTWSYSRISTFEECPYKFYLKYIEPQESTPMFFSEFGGFMHELLEKLYCGRITVRQAVTRYITGFAGRVTGRSPGDRIFSTYFQQGLNCLKAFQPIGAEVIDTERFVSFDINGLQFIGYIDMLIRGSNGIEIWDHKSHSLKPRSNRKKPTKTDAELDDYLRQLYLYSIPVEREFGTAPSRLVFNCYRAQTQVSEDFDSAKLEDTKSWACSCVNRIMRESDWNPNMDFFKCRYLCGVNHCCEYYEMSGGDPI